MSFMLWCPGAQRNLSQGAGESGLWGLRAAPSLWAHKQGTCLPCAAGFPLAKRGTSGVVKPDERIMKHFFVL